MEISVFIDRENSSRDVVLEDNTKVSDLLKKLNLNPVTVIVSKNGELVMESEKISKDDKIKIFSVISGG